ncbi:MAG: hypothetical protein JO246_06235 [Frankiaceae bacterium]|nr:hypothetical protein [Frankiaceae bacterium]MBV9871008.1 hypothetical protein [Frankiaceae bacterium]
MHVWAPVTIASALLLALSGSQKLRRPAPTVLALRSIGLTRAGVAAVTLLGLAELMVGVTAITFGTRVTDAAVAVLYAGFSGFLLRALRTPTSSCGCTGRDDTPPTIGHLVLTTTFAATAIAAAAAGDPTGVRSGGPGTTIQVIAALGFAAVVAWLGWAVLTISPRLAATRRT